MERVGQHLSDLSIHLLAAAQATELLAQVVKRERCRYDTR
jgi:hypothetical protein